MNMENGPHLVVTDPIVLDMLFAQNSSHFELFFQDADEKSTQNLLNQDASFWFDLFNETFSSPQALVMAYPSQDYDNELTKQEVERVLKQVSNVISPCVLSGVISHIHLKNPLSKNRLTKM